MKKLILVRHAKSDWGNPGLDDFDRPLNERGKRDAPAMAARLRDRKTGIDVLLSSPAKRAAKTAKIFAETLGIKNSDIVFNDELYLAGPITFYNVLAELDDEIETVALFSHNNGLTDFANRLTDARIDNIPTCGIFAVQADCNQWSDFKAAPKTFLFFDYPKAV